MRDINAAAHEAAHALVGVWAGLSLLRVVLVEKGSGKTNYAQFRHAPSKRLAWGLMLMAGPAADKLRGVKNKDVHIHDDYTASEMGFMPYELRLLERLANQVIRDHDDCWIEITNALMRRDLSGREVKELYFDMVL